MKTTKRTFGKLLALVLVFLFALTAVVGVLAESVEGQGNLTVTIRNNEGLPPMTPSQFSVYQIFKGKAHQEGEITSENSSAASEWGASQWNNWTLADITWGDSVAGNGTQLVNTLKGLNETENPWAFEGETGARVNVFKDVTADDPESLAKVLATHTSNEFLQDFSKYLMENKEAVGLTAITLTAEEAGKTNPELVPGGAGAADDSLVFTFKDAGYYLFAENPAEHTGGDHKDDAVAEYMLAVVGQQSILLKASVPDVKKDIVADGELKKGDVAGVGDYVQFKLTGTLPKNYGDFDTYKYVFHDTLSKGLTYVNDSAHPLTVRVYDSKTAADADPGASSGGTVVTANTDYTVKTTDIDDGCSLEVSFANLKNVKNGEDALVTADSVIVVTYWAQVNEDAVIGSEGNPNTAELEYSNDPNRDGTGRTTEKKVYVYAFGLDLTKVGDDDAHASGLGGAGFVLKDAHDNYAIFREQWLLTVTTTETNEDESKTTTQTQTFYDDKDEANTAKTTAEGKATEKITVEAEVSSVRRLTGWTSETSVPTTGQVAESIAKYKAGTITTTEDFDECLLMSGTDGAIPDIYGLDEGSYALEEVIVPDGYNTPEEDFDISIEATINAETGKLEKVVYTHGSETVEYYPTADNYSGSGLDNEEIGDRVVRFSSGLLKDDIVNQKAPFLPFTGGIGTTIFYVLGTLLIAGAITYLVIATKKRKNAE